MAKVDLVWLIRHVGSEIAWYTACLDGLWLNEHEQGRDTKKTGINTERVTRTKFASTAVARRAYRAAIRAREVDGFVEQHDISTPGPTINGKGQFARWNVAGSKSWWGRGQKWSKDVEIVVVDTTAKPKPAKKPSRRRRS